jgi:hypothetical protein
MGFFDDMPAAEPEPPRRHHLWEPPEAELPGIVPIDILQLGRTDDVAVAITGMSAFSTGFEIFMTARLRPEHHGHPRERMRSFHLGLQLSDGRKVFGSPGGPPPAQAAEPAGPVLRPYLGGGSPRSHFFRWWAWPLPPSGPLEFVCEWPMFGITETRTGLDAQLILTAARRSIRLWPEDGS